MAAEGRLDPVIGREEELARVIQILSRRTKNNPALIGEPGSGQDCRGRGAGLSHCGRDRSCPPAGQESVRLDLSSMVAGTKYRGRI